ncbi:MFS-type transporter dbaD [Cladobotryum mycophilum]|uniref:MFS-type transporter dbaD n=1 Tax=Cladobotryum mycophilum TaxID=491253 RepID=A0ABR0T4L2_9HYPO
MAAVLDDKEAFGFSKAGSDTSKSEEQRPSELDDPSLAPPVSLPPNGGFAAWLQVLGAFLLFFNSWGVINTFGVYQAYYEKVLLADSSPSSISWIGTFQGFLLFLVGSAVGPLFDKGYLRSLTITGTFFLVFGLMMTSISTEYYQLFLAQGVTVGIGCAFVFLPSIAIVATYFTTKRALATGIAAAGGSIGSVIYPIIFKRLVDPVGFGWATRIIAFIVFGTMLVPIFVMKSRLAPPKQARAIFDFAAFKEPPYLVFCISLFFAFTGMYFPFFYLPTYFEVSLHETGNISFYSLAILNAASVPGRILPGLIADHVGSMNAIIPVGLITSLLAFCWIGIHNVPGIIVFAILYGFASGASVSLPPTICARLCPNMSMLGTRMGMSFFFCGFGLLIGNPIAGALLDLEHAVFWKGQVFSGLMVAVGTCFFVLTRVLRGRETEGWKM